MMTAPHITIKSAGIQGCPRQPRVHGNEEEKDEDKCEDDQDNVQEQVMPRSPATPSAQERLEHSISQIPHMPWRRHCIRGSGRKKPHIRNEVEKKREEINIYAGVK